MSPKHILLFLLVVFSLATNAQTQIEGIVQGADGMPQPYTNVLLLNATDSAFVKGEVADIDGRFAFSDVQTGAYFCELSMVGLATLRTAIFAVSENQ
ncbi:MAG TPA: carboxypeptidase-like regulatory domain-containing protein, partial [Allomuricauda sp.]|nr:carboxypeptidase-like regulatory domain-containing protein [Allomuricauda sp.]